MSRLPESVSLRNVPIHMTGIKGTGMTALAEVLQSRGAVVSGSDVAERFFTDELLERIGVVPSVGFSAQHVPPNAQFLVYSAAYGPDNPEREEAKRRGIPQYSYTEMLGMFSRESLAVAVSGVHGKTSTTAMLGMMINEAGPAATVVVGSGVPGFGGAATLIRGDELFVAETCEYRRHFLDFSPDVLLITSVEADHLDYFRDADDVMEAFLEFGRSLPEGGALVYCQDDPGATNVANRLKEERNDIRFYSYGFTASGVGAITEYDVLPGIQKFRMGELGTTEGTSDSLWWEVAIPGRHMVSNAAAALTVLAALTPNIDQQTLRAWQRGLRRFTGTRRRSEVIGEVDDIIILDDYAHHPTAIKTTLQGFREFWPGRRVVVDFMSHTYSRTEALLDEFCTAFDAADVLFLNDIYASARENYTGGIDGPGFAAAIARKHVDTRYVATLEEAALTVLQELRKGDLFITMGAGDNFRVGTRVLEHLQETRGPGKKGYL